MPLLGSRAVYTPTLVACYAITAAVHVASIVLNTLLPLHVVDLGADSRAGSLGTPRAPPLAFGLRALGGMRLAFAVVTVFAVLLAVIVTRLPSGVAGPAVAASRRPRLISRSALGVSFALVLST